MRIVVLVAVCLALGSGTGPKSFGQESSPILSGSIVDGSTGKPLAARLYIRSAAGEWHFASSASEDGSAIEHRVQRGPRSFEIHTTLSAHPFKVDLPPGKYEIVAERGKEYFPATRTVEIGDKPLELKLPLHRWIDMAAMGWFSGETHVHRQLDELPTLIQAEDLNVALPLTYWVTRSDTPPTQGDKNSPPVTASLITVDPTHVIYPLNTEYEIFTVGARRHTLGAIFALNQRTHLEVGVPPVKPVAEQVHREGGLLELDKHNWPWSMMLVPVMNVDLYELTNNHLWRTEFFFTRFGESPPAYMRVEQNQNGMTERGWINFTFQNYYALLNCGYRLRPTAGTASGVHPVPLGFGRVYVYLPDGFSYDAWMEGLDAGRSFVTTGPLMDIRIDGQHPTTMQKERDKAASSQVTGWVENREPIKTIEIVVTGEVVRTVTPENTRTDSGSYRTEFEIPVELQRSGWIVVRCFTERPDGRIRFAHTAPWHIEIPDRPLRPKRAEVAYLVERVRAEIKRNTGVLSEEAMAEYQEALRAYEQKLEISE